MTITADTASSRSLSLKRRLIFALAQPLLRFYAWFFWATSRVQVIDEHYLQEIVKQGEVCIPCYWHRYNLLCMRYLISLKPEGLNIGFLVSPSHDGEAASRLLQHWGAHVVRGSSSQTGAQALRGLYQMIKEQGVSPASTPDGPRGPIYEFKPGSLMLSQMTQAPVVPIAVACRRYWQLKSWDKFMIPKPFNRIIYIVGKPTYVDRGVKLTAMDGLQCQMQTQLKELQQRADAAI